jgi:GlcNAc-P-P-Und epimerase
VETLLQSGHTVLGTDILSPKNAAHRSVWKPVDLRDRLSMFETVREFSPGVILHLGARTDLDGSSIEDYSANHEGTRNVMEAADGCSSVEKVLFTSSRLVNRIGYQPATDTDYCPTTPYGESKVLGEQLVRAAHGLRYEWTIVRPTSIWGPWFGVPYRNFFDAVLSGRYVHPKGIRVQKSFGFVGNAVHALMALAMASPGKTQGRTFYLADYQPIEVFAFAQEVARQAGAKAVIEIPYPALRVGAAAGDFLKLLGMRNPPLTKFRLANLVTSMHYDTTNLAEIAGPLPFDSSQGIARTLQWLSTQA